MMNGLFLIGPTPSLLNVCRVHRKMRVRVIADWNISPDELDAATVILAVCWK